MAPKTVPVRVDNLLYKQLKAVARQRGHSIKWLMSQALIQYLGKP